MSVLKLLEVISVEEYLEGEKDSPVKHEYMDVDGRVFAFAGASEAHNGIVVNLVGQFYDVVREEGCRLYTSDIKVKVLNSQFYRPDVMVVCDKEDNSDYIKERPCSTVEVLSRSTANTDRREKVDAI